VRSIRRKAEGVVSQQRQLLVGQLENASPPLYVPELYVTFVQKMTWSKSRSCLLSRLSAIASVKLPNIASADRPDVQLKTNMRFLGLERQISKYTVKLSV
jgi:hypothetical protein